MFHVSGCPSFRCVRKLGTTDATQDLTWHFDANNHTTYFAYNARGWVTQTTFPSTLFESYTYDLVGNLGETWKGKSGTSMISKSQEETEVSERLEEKALEAEMRRLG